MTNQDPARTAQLEAALSEAVAYLKRMPVNPSTYDVIQKAEQALHGSAQAPAVMIAQSYAPSGVLVLGAVLMGKSLTLTTADTSAVPKVHRQHRDNLERSLVAGMALPPLELYRRGYAGNEITTIIEGRPLL